MKKFYSYVAVLAISSLTLFSSCSKDSEDPAVVANPEASVTLNENTKISDSDTLYVKRDKLTADIQVNGISKTSTDMKRIYVYKKSTGANAGSYETYNGSGFKKDGNNNYYYDIPSDQKNNTTLNLTVTLNANNVAAIVDEYYFAFTTGSNYGGPGTSTGLLLGPAQIFIAYGILSETTGHRLNNIQGPNSGAFDLVTLTNKSASDLATGKDMIDQDASTALWEKAFTAGTSATTYVKISNNFDYTNATDISIAAAYAAGTALSTQLNVATGNMFVAKLRGLNNYALIKVTFISDENGQTGSGNNNEYMEFSVKK